MTPYVDIMIPFVDLPHAANYKQFNSWLLTLRKSLSRHCVSDMVNGTLNGAAPVPPQLLGRNSPLDIINTTLPAMNGTAYNCSSPTAILPPPTG